MEYFTDREFQDRDLNSGKLIRGTYDTCVFREVNFTGAFLDGLTFLDCEFIDCNLSNASFGGSQFTTTKFEGCKMLGLRMVNLGLMSSGISFSDCQMDFIYFSGINLKGVHFENCSLKEADFSESDLEEGVFLNCQLQGAQFYQTNLERADLRSAYGISLNPEENKIRKARFSLELLPGLLKKYGIEIDRSG